MTYIREDFSHEVDIYRKDGTHIDQRDSFRVIASDVIMDIQPIGPNLQFLDIGTLHEKMYVAMPETPVVGIREADKIVEFGKDDLFVVREDTLDDVQQLILTTRPKSR